MGFRQHHRKPSRERSSIAGDLLSTNLRTPGIRDHCEPGNSRMIPPRFLHPLVANRNRQRQAFSSQTNGARPSKANAPEMGPRQLRFTMPFAISPSPRRSEKTGQPPQNRRTESIRTMANMGFLGAVAPRYGADQWLLHASRSPRTHPRPIVIVRLAARPSSRWHPKKGRTSSVRALPRSSSECERLKVQSDLRCNSCEQALCHAVGD